MVAEDAWLKRQNEGLRKMGVPVSLEVEGKRIRLRAMMPPKPPTTGSPRQQRISTGLIYPQQVSEAVDLARRLGSELLNHQLGQQMFRWEEWERKGNKQQAIAINQQLSVGINGDDAINETWIWWQKQRARSASAAATWQKDYLSPLRSLKGVLRVDESVLASLIEATAPGTKTRKRTAMAAAAVARALAYEETVIRRLKDNGKGYSEINSAKNRELPTDERIIEFIDSLPRKYQWPTAVMATFGCRPHEALRYATVNEKYSLIITGGKTGPRHSLPLPKQWIEMWELQNKELPKIKENTPDGEIGSCLNRQFKKRGCEFAPYDLRHCFAVRTIMEPKISPTLAAKSMGHSLEVHTRKYQRYFDSKNIESIIDLLD
jgi:integrase